MQRAGWMRNSAIRDTIRWILEQQESDNWSNNEIDTAYALIALGDCGIKNEPGCEWLLRHCKEHTGTTSLIITALLKQDKNKYTGFIKNRAGWILSKRQSGGWIHIATSNLAIQALIQADEKGYRALDSMASGKAGGR